MAVAKPGTRGEMAVVIAVGYGRLLATQLVSLARNGFERRVVITDRARVPAG